MAILHENVCRSCVEKVFSPGRRSGVHHLSKFELDSSAREGCVICRTLKQDVDNSSKEVSVADWPLYRWNVHKHAQLREGLDMLYVIFRAIAPEDHVESVASLPDRRFNLHREQDWTFSSISTLGPSTDAPQAWRQIERWLQACSEDNHPNCKRPVVTIQDLPTRLIDLDDININDRSGRIKLVETRAWTNTAPYVTLSHSWGTEPSFYKVTVGEMALITTEGIPLNHAGLSQNVQDAVLATKRLKIRYIWVDFMCIIQENDADWNREAELMHKYYRNAYCNISASASRRPGDGLFRRRNQHGQPFYGRIARQAPASSNRILGECAWIVVPADIWEAVLLQSPLYKRAWVFQERVLAARMIHFAAQEIFFECATTSACESFPDGIPHGSDRMAVSSRQWRQWLHRLSHTGGSVRADLVRESLDVFWQTVVRIYTGCQLSYATDKLKAISGVAQLLKEGFGEEPGKGLWSKRLEEQLAWRVEGCRQADGSPSRRLDNGEPTWSWASMDGVVTMQKSRLIEEREYRVCGHDGKPIQYEVTEDVNAPALLRTLSDEAKGLPQTPMAVPQHSNQKRRNNAVIKIRGYSNTGAVVWLKDAGKWVLQVPDWPATTFAKLAKNHTVFPDVNIETNLQSCVFMVIAYSKRLPIIDREDVDQPEKIDSLSRFHGIGLILHDIGDNYCERFGSFTFINLSQAELSVLIPMVGSFGDKVGNETHNDNGGMHDSQATKIFLV